MTSLFDRHEISFSCPGCGYKVSKTIGWLRSHDDFTCPGCGRTIHVETDQLERGLKEVERAIDDFRRKIERLGKRR